LQDGDYFLTTLLLNPLSNKKDPCENLKIDFITEQKKHFQFRKYQKEIGGDLCTSHRIFLRNRPFTVFLNADAMGKSIQGAGGILVLGSVFQNIIERTHAVNAEKEKYPERWLKNTILELHKTFESFDGSMLVSVILGLIDEKTGMMYYINAEHPFMILLRDGKADFLEKELKHHKLGTTGLQGKIHVDTFQLMPGDVIFSGSDGKDDLRMKDESGEEYVNEDETQILRIIEKSGGDLEKVYHAIRETGELMDDLSLMRIEYSPSAFLNDNSERREKAMELYSLARKKLATKNLKEAEKLLREALSLQPELDDALRAIIRLHLEQKDYASATSLLDGYTCNHPAEENYLYLASYCHRKNRNYQKAIDLGERLRIRAATHTENLINLGKSYIMMKNPERARAILKEALELEPDNKNARELWKKLASGTE